MVVFGSPKCPMGRIEATVTTRAWRPGLVMGRIPWCLRGEDQEVGVESPDFL